MKKRLGPVLQSIVVIVAWVIAAYAFMIAIFAGFVWLLLISLAVMIAATIYGLKAKAKAEATAEAQAKYVADPRAERVGWLTSILMFLSSFF